MINHTITSLYDVFSKYPGDRNMAGSPLYGEKVQKWNRELYSKELTKLTGDDLSKFCGSVTLTWGELDDYKHFLPRIYELISQIQCPYEAWIIFEVLNKQNWKNWPNDEVEVLTKYFVDLWASTVNDSSENNDYIVEDYLASIANVYEDFDKLLYIWEVNESKQSVRKLVYYFTEHYNDIFIKVRLPGFHRSESRGKKTLDWITGSAMKRKLNKKRKQYQDEDFSIEMGWLVDTINAIK